MAKPYPYFVSLNDAKEICFGTKIKLKSELINLDNALNRIISQDVIAIVNDPPFDNSSMDGFAVIFDDTKLAPVTLDIIGTSNAGSGDNLQLTSGKCVRIMTGAPIPLGADSIIPVEMCQIDNQKVTLNEISKPHFIRKKGENFNAGDVLFHSGERLTPEKISLCAAAGVNELLVYCKLNIAVISTGDELKKPGSMLDFGEIYESNSYGISALIQSIGYNSNRFPLVIDDINELRKTLDEAAQSNDLIITSGGVSMGERDFVRILMEKEGEINFWRVKIRPGSPPIFGLWKQTPIFGLPGNPVSSHVVFRILVAPFLANLTNTKSSNERIIYATLANDIKTVEGFTTFRRVELIDDENTIFARLKGHQGSGNIAGIAMSDGLTILGPNSKGKKGETCKILLL